MNAILGNLTDAVQSRLPNLLMAIGVLVLAGAMALRQMGLANQIITLAFGLLLGAVAFAIAFGIGGRDIATETINKWAKKVDTK